MLQWLREREIMPLILCPSALSPVRKTHTISQADGQTSSGLRLAGIVPPALKVTGKILGQHRSFTPVLSEEFHFLGELRHGKGQEALPKPSW